MINFIISENHDVLNAFLANPRRIPVPSLAQVNHNVLVVNFAINSFKSMFEADNDSQLNTLYDSVYFLKNNKNSLTSIEQLLKDIERLPLNSGATLYILSEDSLFLSADNKVLTRGFARLNDWITQTGISVQFCTFGTRTTSHLLPVLNNHCTQIGSTSVISALVDGQYRYNIIYMHTAQGLITDTSYIFAPGATSPTLENNDKNILNELKHAADFNEVLTLKSLLREKETAPADFQLIETLDQLFQVASTKTSASIVLPCSTYNDIEPIAHFSYRLRQLAGNKLKLIVRETNQCIRYSDERFLLNSGINLIVPAELSFSRLISQKNAIQNQIYTHRLPAKYEDLHSLRPSYGIHGITDVDLFTHHVKSLVSQQINLAVDFVLVRLDLLPDMTARECLSLCNLRRDGDLLTPCHDAIYIFLSAVRINDITPALNNIFEIRVADLFKESTFFTCAVDITEELERARKTAIPLTKEFLANLETRSPTQKTPTLNNQARSYAKRIPLERKSQKVLA